MEYIYYVRNKETRRVLNKKLNWSKNIFSYGLMVFESKEDAVTAFPEGIDCEVVTVGKAEKKIMLNAKFFIKSINSNRLYLDKNDNFSLKSYLLPEAASFSSEEEAIAKADALNIDLDSIRVIVHDPSISNNPD